MSRPVIRIKVGDVERIVDEAEAALIAADRGLYQRANTIVSVGDTKIISSQGEVIGRRIFERGDHALLEDLNVAAEFERFDRRTKGFVPTDAPMNVVRTLQQRTGRLEFPILMGVVTAPTLRGDGSLLDRPGYDKATGLLYEPVATTFPSIPAKPSRRDALAALSMLRQLIETFPFTSDADRSVALSAMLTACVRRSLRTAPMHAFTAPTAGSGKSMLVDIASVLATGREAGVIAQGKSEEEMEKRLGSMFLAGDPIVSIDNCEEPLGGEFLCQALTQQSVRVRILGRSETPELPTNIFVAATGNNLRLAGDMTRRALLSNLDPRVERPELRQFDINPVARAKERRGALVMAALTILRAFVVEDRPAQVDALGSFEDWSRMVRNALIWIGCADPVATMEQARAADPRLDELTGVLTQWHEVMGSDRVSVRQVVAKATEKKSFSSFDNGAPPDFIYPDFREALLTVAGAGGAINTRRLGKWLAANQRRIVSGRFIENWGLSEGLATWKLCASVPHDVVPDSRPGLVRAQVH